MKVEIVSSETLYEIAEKLDALCEHLGVHGHPCQLCHGKELTVPVCPSCGRHGPGYEEFIRQGKAT